MRVNDCVIAILLHRGRHCLYDCKTRRKKHCESEKYEENIAERMKKKTIQIYLLALLLLLSAFPAVPSRAEEAPTLGDLTGDGLTSAADAAAMLRAIAFGKLHEDARPDLDFTKNGEIDGMDARAALFYACGGISDWISFGERVSSGLCDERLFDQFS